MWGGGVQDHERSGNLKNENIGDFRALAGKNVGSLYVENCNLKVIQ